MNTHRGLWSAIFVMTCLALVLSYSCVPEYEEAIIPPSQFTKQQREALGDKIKIAIAFDEERFPVLPNIPPYDTTVYLLVQTLYDQATNEIRRDRQSPQNNKWNPDRPWKITVLTRPEKNIFVIPGGDIYLTTGLLKSLETEHELYYLLAFEANLINEKLLLYQIINRINTNALAKIAEGSALRDDPGTKDIVAIIDHLEFDVDQVKILDQMTLHLICTSSIMNPFGIARIADQTDNDWLWLDYRSNYPGREERLRALESAEESCGDFTTNANYARYVLGIL